MNKNLKKLFLGLLTTTIVTVTTNLHTSASVNINTESKVSLNDLDSKMREAKFPEELIEYFSEDAKINMLSNNIEFEASETTYGILTEDTQIFYQKDTNGQIEMDKENSDKFREFLKDENQVKKVIEDKNEAMGTNFSVNGISRLSDGIALYALSNWSHNLTALRNTDVSSSNDVSFILCYTWTWDYSPAMTLTDKVGMAWSNSFTAQPSSTRISVTGTKSNGTTMKYLYQTGNNAYNEFTPNSGIGRSINIQSGYKKHSGYFQTELLKKSVSGGEHCSAVGKYYHQNLSINGTLGFSASGPTISLSNSYAYTDSGDRGVAFSYK